MNQQAASWQQEMQEHMSAGMAYHLIVVTWIISRDGIQIASDLVSFPHWQQVRFRQRNWG
jgi:hypothetical protein